MVEYVTEYIFSIWKKKQQKDRRKAKEIKEEKWIFMENLTVYDGIVCEFAFNLFDRGVNFSWLLYEFSVGYVQREKYREI